MAPQPPELRLVTEASLADSTKPAGALLAEKASLLAEASHAGFSLQVGPGPLPDPSTMPNTLYILVPEVAS